VWAEEGALIGALALVGTIFSLFVFFKFWVRPRFANRNDKRS
jgi:hypothetical protein